MKDRKDAIKLWKERLNSDKKRYEKYYKLNPNDKSQYDFVLDTSNLNQKQVAEKVLEFIKSKTKKTMNTNQ